MYRLIFRDSSVEVNGLWQSGARFSISSGSVWGKEKLSVTAWRTIGALVDQRPCVSEHGFSCLDSFLFLLKLLVAACLFLQAKAVLILMDSYRFVLEQKNIAFRCLLCGCLQFNWGHVSGKRWNLSTVMRHLTTGLRSEKCVVRRFRRCANVIQCTYTNLDSAV